MDIIKLNERISNMIAAGEVVTRPANALKELIENSIDANSTSITVELFDNGLKQIKVIDNGHGMNKENLEKAFLRHATSKIKTEYDLAHIATLGFRGEAIPAIASVSKMTIESKQKGATGNFVTYEGGRLKESGSVALNDGTTVTINDLFYNVPARLKFIRNPQTELSHLIEVVDEFIFSHPNISFKLLHEDKVIRQSFGDNNYESLFEHIFGKNTSTNMIKINEDAYDIKIEAYLGSPEVTRSRRNNIYIFLNGRSIKNFILTNAVIEGYHTRLMTNRYPIGVIKLTIDPILVDVNVHPQKREVKISNEYVIASMLRKIIRSQFDTYKKDIKGSLETYTQVSGFDYLINELELNYDQIKEENIVEVTSQLPYLEYIGQFAGTYLLFQNERGLYLIDQHAAAERVRYEYYYEKLGDKFGSKGLLIPLDFEFKPTEEVIINTHLKELKEFGFDFEPSGPTGFYLNEIPIWLNDEDVYTFVLQMIESLEKYGELNLKDLRDNLSKSIACKGAIKANEPLSRDEVNHLMDSLKETKNPYYCPHGRPVLIHFTFYEIERLFKRIV